MRRFLLVITTCCLTLFVKAQFTSVWEKTAGASYSWFTTTSSNTTGCAYNPVTNKLLLADRNNLIAIINVATGASEGTLVTTGVGTESFKWNKIRVTSDGVIYGISLQTTAGGACKVYRWDNQTAVPTLCATFTVTERCGDSFGLSGVGTGTVLYASGNGITGSAVNIYVLTTADGLNFSVTNTINIPITGTNAWSGRSVDPVTTGTSSDLWIRSQNTNTRRISSTGTVLYTSVDGSGTDQVPANFSNARYFQSATGKKFLALVGTSAAATGGLQLRVLNVTNEAAVTNVGTATLTNTFNTNTSGIGDVAIKDNGDNTFTFFYVIPNNGVMAVLTDKSLPVNISAFDGELKNNAAKLTWHTDNEINNNGFYIEKSLDGTNFSAINFVASKANNNTNTFTYVYIDEKVKPGKNYYRLKQVDKDGKFVYSKIVAVTNEVRTKDFSVRVLSNPVKESIQLNITSVATKQVQILITDVAGKTWLTQQQPISIGENNIAINISALPKGLLLVTVGTAEETTSKKTISILKQ